MSLPTALQSLDSVQVCYFRLLLVLLLHEQLFPPMLSLSPSWVDPVSAPVFCPAFFVVAFFLWLPLLTPSPAFFVQSCPLDDPECCISNPFSFVVLLF